MHYNYDETSADHGAKTKVYQVGDLLIFNPGAWLWTACGTAVTIETAHIGIVTYVTANPDGFLYATAMVSGEEIDLTRISEHDYFIIQGIS